MADPGPRARALRLAAAELQAAYALVSDAHAPDYTAARHVVDAWRHLRAGAAATDAGDDDELAAWVGRDPLNLSKKSSQSAAALLSRLMPLARAGPRDGDDDGPPARALLEHLRFAGRVHDRLAGRGGARAERARRWTRRALLWGGIGAALVLMTLRPWDRHDTGPWRAAYYPGKDLRGAPDVQREPALNLDWRLRPPTDSIPADRFSARFDSCLVLEQDTNVGFQLESDDGARLYVDGALYIDDWDEPGRGTQGAFVSLSAGRHHLHVEFIEEKYDARLLLRASFSPETPPEPIPARMLEYPGDELPEDASPCAPST